MSPADSVRLPWERSRLSRAYARAPRLALAGADAYVTAGSALARGALGGLPPALAPPPVALDLLRLGSGALAAVHVGAGLYGLWAGTEGLAGRARTLRRLQAGADLLTAAALAGQTLGLGPWTAAVALPAALTAAVLHCLRVSEEVA